MYRLAMAGVAIVSIAATLVPVSAAADVGSGAPYAGVEYDQGGVSRPVDGPVPQVDELADRITRSTPGRPGAAGTKPDANVCR